MGESENEHWPEYHDHDHGPDSIHLHTPHDLLFYVEHDPDQKVTEKLTSRWLVGELPGEFNDYHLSQAVVDSMDDLPGVYFPAAVKEGTRTKAFTLFCVRSPKLNVSEEYQNFNEANSSGTGIKLKNNKSTIQSVLPNWFNAAAYHIGVGPHGPGGPPRPVTDRAVIKRLAFKFKPRKPKGDPGLRAKTVKTLEEPVKIVVYILDTIPNQCRIRNALSTWPLLGLHYTNILAPKDASAPPDPDKYESLQATYHYGGSITPKQDFSESFLRNDPTPPQPHPYAVGRHQYDSSDHGLFIAGIVHMLAPEAKIHVIQVMGDNGVGTFDNFAAGFRKMAALHEKEKERDPNCHAIVNCSFTLATPIFKKANEKGVSPIQEDVSPSLRGFPQDDAAREAIDEQVNRLIAAMQDSLETGALIAAASGNESLRNTGNVKDVKDPRYPAKFPKVVGVGALRANDNFAVYSNRNDDPNSDGLYVFGGDYTNGTARLAAGADEKNVENDRGIISIFTGNLNIKIAGAVPLADDPSFFVNPSGYADWKGTSFATPVFAGTVALLCRLRNKNPRDVYDFDVKLYINKITRKFVDVFQEQ